MCSILLFCQVYYLLTELSPSWEAANCAVTQEPSIIWNPEVHYRAHKRPSLVPILSQIDPVHTNPCYLSKITFDIVHPPPYQVYYLGLNVAILSEL
jgi:hypothetical protein